MDQYDDRSERRETMTVEAWVSQLTQMVSSMITRQGRVASVTQFEDGRYVQFWVEPDGIVIAEVISNLYTGDEIALSRDDEAALRRMGWHEPRRGPNPNWYLVARRAAELVTMVDIVRRVVDEVLRESPANSVSVHTWTIERRWSSLDDLREESRVHYRRALDGIRIELDGR
jgi:hypothetical protein